MSLVDVALIVGIASIVLGWIGWFVHRVNKVVVAEVVRQVSIDVHERTEGLQPNGGMSVGDLPTRMLTIEQKVAEVVTATDMLADKVGYAITLVRSQGNRSEEGLQ